MFYRLSMVAVLLTSLFRAVVGSFLFTSIGAEAAAAETSVAQSEGEWSEIYLYDLDLAASTVNQTIVIDEDTQQIYATQAKTLKGDKAESFVISRLTIDGQLIDSMTVRYGGHGTSIGLERDGSAMYIWSNMLSVDSRGRIKTQFLTRYPYSPGAQISIDSPAVQKFAEYPNPEIYMSPFTDAKNGIIAYRQTILKFGRTESRVEVRRMEDIKNGMDRVLYSYAFPKEMNKLVLQGMTLDGPNLYLTFGQKAKDFHLYHIDLPSGKILKEIKRPVGLNAKGRYEANFGEPEGLYLYTDPETKLKTLLTVIVTDAPGKRRQKLFAFSWNDGVEKFLQLAERAEGGNAKGS